MLPPNPPKLSRTDDRHHEPSHRRCLLKESSCRSRTTCRGPLLRPAVPGLICSAPVRLNPVYGRAVCTAATPSRAVPTVSEASDSRFPALSGGRPWTRPTRPATRCAVWPRRRSPPRGGTTPADRRPGRRRPRPADQAEAADQAQTLAEAQQLAAEVFGAEGAELAAGLTWTAVGTGQATATINEHVLVYHRTPVLWTRARAAHSPLGESWWPTSDGTRPTGYRKLGPSLGLLLRCGGRQQLGYAPSPALAEAGQVLRRTSTDTCASWNPWETNYRHQGLDQRNRWSACCLAGSAGRVPDGEPLCSSRRGPKVDRPWVDQFKRE